MNATTRRADSPRTRADFHAAQGVLLVTRAPPPAPPPAKGQPALISGNPLEGVEILIAVWDDGSVTALNGHVDLGTGIRTALAQIVAEELDVTLDRVNMVLGDTTRAPNQGATIASASIQIHAVPLRAAAAQARAWLLARAADRLQADAMLLEVNAGVVSVRGAAERQVAYAALLAGRHEALSLQLDTPVKPAGDYRIVGTSTPRLDIPAKATGALTFVHDMRVPGMLHGRVVRPPYAGADHGDFIGNTLASVDEASIAHIPGIRAVVVIRDFIGIVAEREEHAEQALRELKVAWKPWAGLHPAHDLNDPDALAEAIRSNPATQRRLIDEGDVEAAIAGAAQSMARSYVWPYQLHGAIGPSCALADWRGARMTVWAGTQNPHVLRADLSRLMGLADIDIDVIRMEAAGCYGRNCADDVAADAALLSRAVGAPVRVQLTREQEHAWEPKGAAQLMQVRGGLTAGGAVAGYDFETSYPSNGAPTLALLLTRTIEPTPQAYEMGDRTARPPYAFEHLRVAVNDMAPLLRASWLRGVSALPNVFAHESYIDELATAAGVDPLEFRLRYLHEPRAAELLRTTAERAGWRAHTGPRQRDLADGQAAADASGPSGEHGQSAEKDKSGEESGQDGNILRGQGVAYARYVHSKWPGYGAAWAAWVADVEVNRTTGQVHVRRVVVGHDAGALINPAGAQHQIHGNVVQTTSRALGEQVSVNPITQAVNSLEWGSYPILNFREVPIIEVVTMARPGEPPLGVGESSSVPGTAAIANAIFDATGVRFRQPPFTPEKVRAALHPVPASEPAQLQAKSATPPAMPGAELESPQVRLPSTAVWPQRLGRWSRVGALLAGAFGLATALLGGRAAIPALQPAPAGAASIYTAVTLARGRQLAAAGDCVVCHTAPGGTPNAGGRRMDTPFGQIVTTNLTPDADTGIGLWPFSAFQRAMREGISRDGHHLYPAFPYTAFAKTSDEDLMALYAYLMAQPAVRAELPATRLAFPYSVRPLMAGWNALFHDPAPYQPVASQTAEWNRGAYLVTGLGHCGACHTPRNAFGAEKGGKAFLSGAMVDGWEAPALTALSRAPVPWTAGELYGYLRWGHTPAHGIAAGPMAPVVEQLGALPDEDIRAMASYLASFNQPLSDKDSARRAQQVVLTAQQTSQALPGVGQRLFSGACASCHHDGDGPTLLGVNTPLALNSNLHSDRPDNLIRVILGGIRTPATPDIGFMPAFRHSLDDGQIAALAIHMRSRYAPGQPAWAQVKQSVSRLRGLGDAH